MHIKPIQVYYAWVFFGFTKKISSSQICEITKMPNQEFGHTPQGRWKGVAGILS